jgi:hypothetical protein
MQLQLLDLQASHAHCPKLRILRSDHMQIYGQAIVQLQISAHINHSFILHWDLLAIGVRFFFLMCHVSCHVSRVMSYDTTHDTTHDT